VVARADAILAALVEVDACVVDAERHPDTALRAVHDVALLEFLESAWDEWTAAGLDREPGQDRVVPYVFAHAALTSAHFWWTLVKDAFESALNGPCGDGTNPVHLELSAETESSVASQTYGRRSYRYFCIFQTSARRWS
jgi:acetoin utilization deacetylase AcuC-like enzyme